jgi:hypothetical protein
MVGKPAGGYLVRLNEEMPGTYIVTFAKDDGGVGHALILKEARGYTTDSRRYVSPPVCCDGRRCNRMLGRHYMNLDDLLFTHSTKSLRTPLAPVRRTAMGYDRL